MICKLLLSKRVLFQTDDTPPIVTSCGGDIRKEVDSGSNVTVYWTVPSAVDTEGGTVTVTSTHRPGDLFVKGVTTVIYTFWDSGDNLATCSFTVNVYGRLKTMPIVEKC